MIGIKRKPHPDMEMSIENKSRQRPRIKLENAPDVSNLKDLVKLSSSFKFYKNIDIVMLWRIEPFLKELDDMIGMESLKETIFYQIIYYLQGMHSKNRNQEYLHTVIYGNPGCGKTSVAKIIGKIYQGLNILSQDGIFKIAYRDDFIAGYLGQTAIKTKKLLQSCIGGVLFIDEVYSLAPRNNDRDSFSKEAIDTITGFLSDHKNDFCCIVAGYEEEVRDCFFGMNKGLERRFPWIHKIPDYTSSELYKIFIKMISDINWSISVDDIFMIDMFEKHKQLFKNAGGDIETFLSKCKIFHSKRVFSLDKQYKFIITKEDVTQAIYFLEKNNKQKEDKPPEHMYT